jgi:RIB43A
MSLPLTSLQAKLEAKEEMKLKFKRDANLMRNQRFLNARQRVIGVDVDALDMQVWEKKMAAESDKETARIESRLIK